MGADAREQFGSFLNKRDTGMGAPGALQAEENIFFKLHSGEISLHTNIVVNIM